MDNFLSGREQVGDAQKSAKKDASQDQSQADDLDLADLGDSATLEETKGDAGSKVTYITEEGRVTRIVVTCACGQVTEIDCDYEV